MPNFSHHPTPSAQVAVVPPPCITNPHHAIPPRQLQGLSDELGKLISRDSELFHRIGWQTLIRQRRKGGDLSSLENVRHHPAHHLLRQYKYHGSTVGLHSPPWTEARLLQALRRGPHPSAKNYHDFLREEFTSMVAKGQWIVLPFNQVKHLPNLHLSPPGVIPQRERRPRWICDYTFSGVNKDTIDLFPQGSMQFGHALDRIIREVVFSNPKYGPVHLIKVDISDGYYRVDLRPEDVAKLAVVFPTTANEEPLVAFPLVLPMGWKNSPPIFCAATETIADVANKRLHQKCPVPTHPLSTLASLSDEHSQQSTTPHITGTPPNPDPYLCHAKDRLKYIDVFVDDFLGCGQGSKQQLNHLRSTLLHAIDDVFRPLKPNEGRRAEPVSIKKLRKGDCSWSTCKMILGWMLNTIDMTITLPEHRVERLAQILASIPITQKRTSVDKWHKVLGELRSMSIAMPGSRGLFSHLQHALTTLKGKRLNLHKGVHQAIQDFKWLHRNIASRPTRLQELVPTLPTVTGDHDASGKGAGGILIPATHAIPRKPYRCKPVVWGCEWPEDITNSLVSFSNPSGSLNNSDLELAGNFLQLEAAAQCFDIRERTVLNRTDNLNTLFWSRKGSATTSSVPAHLLRLMSIHQRYHRYLPRHDYLPGKLNTFADDASRLAHLSDTAFLNHFNSTPQNNSFQLWRPSSKILSVVISALRKTRCNRESLLNAPAPPMPTGSSGPSSQLNWASTPYSKPSRTKYLSSKFSPSVSELASSPVVVLPSTLDPLRITYGRLARRSWPWGPKTPDTPPKAKWISA